MNVTLEYILSSLMLDSASSILFPNEIAGTVSGLTAAWPFHQMTLLSTQLLHVYDSHAHHRSNQFSLSTMDYMIPYFQCYRYQSTNKDTAADRYEF